VADPGDEMRMLMEPLLNLKNGDSPAYLVKPARLGDQLMVLGGEAALAKPKPPINWKKYVLYGGLLACLTLVGVMAWKLSGEMGSESDYGK